MSEDEYVPPALPPSEYVIEWDPNPLKTRILLTDFGVGYLRLRLYADHLEDALFERAYHKQILAEDAYERVEAWVGRLTPELVSALQDTHVGDCTCVPCSCSKCLAEDLIGVRTTRGLGKHEGSYLLSMFAKHTEIDAVLGALKDYDASKWEEGKKPFEGWEKHVPRWNREAANAYAWLKSYKEEHGF